jgi:hypothetical protein
MPPIDVFAASLLAAAGLLFPVVLFVALRSTRERAPWEIAVDIPVAMSLDLFVVLVLALVVRLEIAAVISRVLYLVAGAVRVAYFRRVGRPRWPAALGRRDVARVAGATAMALGLSLTLSRKFVIWDRHWHIALTGSLRGQTVPFHNVYDASQVVRYHFAGNVHASMLQTLSGGVLHSSFGMSLAHDLHFALIGVVLGLLMTGWGCRAAWQHLLGIAAFLLQGPCHLFRQDIRTPQEGYAFVSYISLSFRPHAALGGLLVLGFAACLLGRLASRDDLPLRRTAPSLVAIAAAMAITDETSLGVLGLALGLTWLVAPRIVHERRLYGVLVFVALAAALVVPNLVFSGSLSGGAGSERMGLKIVPWRVPGYYKASIPLTDPVGRLMLAYDLCAPSVVAVGSVVVAFIRRARGRGVFVAFYCILYVISTVALTRLDLKAGRTEELHRFYTAAFLMAPLVFIVVLSPRFPVIAPVPSRPVPFSIGVMLAGLGFAAFSSVDRIWVAPTWAPKHHDFSAYNFYEVNCRKAVGDSRWMRTRFTYVNRAQYYLIAGCIPAYTPGFSHDSTWHVLTIGLPYEKADAVSRIRKALPADASIPLVCPAKPDKNDNICTAAESAGTCKPAGTEVKNCTLDAARARALAP